MMRIAIAVLTALGSAALAQPVRLVADLNPEPLGSSPWPLVRMDDRVYFGAQSPAHGRELWATDGTAAGTSLVADLRPGPESGLSIFADPGRTAVFTRLGDSLVLAIDDGVAGAELWTRSAAGDLRLLRDIRPGTAGSFPRDARLFDGVLYFIADDGVHGAEPWRTDGTPEGTRMVADVVPGSAGSHANVVAADALGVYLSGPGPAFLWRKLDALPSAVILAEGEVLPGDCIIHDGALLFPGNSTQNGVELWRSGGTPATTSLLLDIVTGSAPAGPRTFIRYRNAIWFSLESSLTGSRLMRTDGTAPGTTQLNIGFGGRTMRILGIIDDRLAIAVGDITSRFPDLILTDGASIGTTLVNPLSLVRPTSAGPYPSYSPQMVEAGGSHYFLGAPRTAPLSGSRVYQYTPPGAIASLAMAIDVPALAQIGAFEVLGGRIIAAGTSQAGETELWLADPATGAAPVRIADINPGTADSDLAWLRAADSRLYFLEDGATPRLRVSEGTPQTTRLVRPIAPEVAEEAPGLGPVSLGRELIFENHTRTSGVELWVSDGVEGGAAPGTRMIRDITPGALGTQTDQLTVCEPSRIYFRRLGESIDVWRTDLSEAGTVPLSAQGGAFASLSDLDGDLLCVGQTALNAPPAFWRSNDDGTALVLVAEFPWLSIASTPLTVIPGSGVACFPAGVAAPGGRELWRTDGTAAGTHRVADIIPGPSGSAPAQISAAGIGADGSPRAFFTAIGEGTGRELWYTDGAAAGTRLVRDIRPGESESGIESLVTIVPAAGPGSSSAARAFFIADDGSLPGGLSRRLWTSDGTEAGTRALPDIRPGAADIITQLTPARDRVFFAADDGVRGLELWTSDGTDAGTRIVTDLRPGPAGGLDTADLAHPGRTAQITLVNSRVYFYGADDAHGRELFVVDTCPADFDNNASVSLDDLFSYLAAYFAQSDRADTNAIDGVTVQDLFEWLAAWFAGCE